MVYRLKEKSEENMLWHVFFQKFLENLSLFYDFSAQNGSVSQQPGGQPQPFAAHALRSPQHGHHGDPHAGHSPTGRGLDPALPYGRRDDWGKKPGKSRWKRRLPIFDTSSRCGWHFLGLTYVDINPFKESWWKSLAINLPLVFRFLGGVSARLDRSDGCDPWRVCVPDHEGIIPTASPNRKVRSCLCNL